jgi:hypothetical protein
VENGTAKCQWRSAVSPTQVHRNRNSKYLGNTLSTGYISSEVSRSWPIASALHLIDRSRQIMKSVEVEECALELLGNFNPMACPYYENKR